MHCSVTYDDERQRYIVKDHASQAGTFVNNKRLAKVRLSFLLNSSDVNGFFCCVMYNTVYSCCITIVCNR